VDEGLGVVTFLAIKDRLTHMPASWQEVRFKRAFAPVDNRAADSGARRLSLVSAGHLYPREGAVDRQHASDATEARSLLIEPGDLVVNPMWLTGGSIAVSGLHGAVSPDYRVFRPTNRMHPRYAHHLLRSQPYLDQYKLFVRANTTFDRRVQQVDLDAMPLPLPPLDEQGRIVDFLDDRVTRIDRIIAARRAQMAKLTLVREARLQSLQDELVVRFGESRLGYLIAGLEQGWSPQAEAIPAPDDEWGVMRSGCVNGGVFRADDHKRLPEGLDPRTEYELRAGDLLMSRASGSLDLIGSVAVVPDHVRGRLLLCDKLYRLTPSAAWRADYLAPMLRSRRNRERIRLGVSGADGMANNLPSGVIRDLRVPLVPQHGQAGVVRQLDEAVESEVSGVECLTRSVDRLAEYKTSLITAAVTGSFNVTAASGVPA